MSIEKFSAELEKCLDVKLMDLYPPMATKIKYDDVLITIRECIRESSESHFKPSKLNCALLDELLKKTMDKVLTDEDIKLINEQANIIRLHDEIYRNQLEYFNKYILYALMNDSVTMEMLYSSPNILKLIQRMDREDEFASNIYDGLRSRTKCTK